MAAKNPEMGDTPHMQREASLVDPDIATAHNREVHGDRPVEGEVHLVQDTSTVPLPTIQEFHDKGYLVSEEDPGMIQADTPVEAGKVNLYIQKPEYPGGPEPEEAEIKTVEGGSVTAVSDPSPEEQAVEGKSEKKEARADLLDALADGPSLAATEETTPKRRGRAKAEAE